MKVTCGNCNRSLDIPSERLPLDSAIAFPCPGCKAMINLDRRTRVEKEADHGARKATLEFLKGDPLKKKILGTVGQLPPMPQTVLKARQIMSNPGSDFKELGDLLETDQAIAAKVLKLANSSYYGLSGKISSIKHASVVLGHKALGELITMGGTASILGKNLEGYGLDAGQLWRHSLGVAFGSRIIANRKNPALANDAFTSGLLHDAGKLILNPYLMERKELFDQLIAGGQESFLAAEKTLLEFDHAEIASEVCEKWNIPQSLATAIRYHHHPSKSGEDELTYMVHVADGISLMAGLGLGIDGMMYELEDGALELLGIKEEELNDIMAEVLQSVKSISDQMG
jgi:HD-like signal output (HDOD) protein